MTQEIKFRVWEKTDCRMLDLAEMSHDAFNIVMFHDLILKGKKSLTTGGKTYEYEVMQFTGLKDKNGKEIYEGDILRWNKLFVYGTEQGLEKMTTVEWVESRLQFRTGGETLTSVVAGYSDSGSKGNTEVIGNIYDNPELVKTV